MPAPFVVTPESRARPLNVLGEKMYVLASGGTTGGYEIFVQDGEAGQGPPDIPKLVALAEEHGLNFKT